MKKDAFTIFAIFFGLFIGFTILFTIYIDSVINAVIGGGGDIIDLLTSAGIFGWLFSILAGVFFIISAIAFNKMLTSKQSAGIAFCASIGAFIIFAVLFAYYVNSVVGSLFGIVDPVEILDAYGLFGVLYVTLIVAFLVYTFIALVRFFKSG